MPYAQNCMHNVLNFLLTVNCPAYENVVHADLFAEEQTGTHFIVRPIHSYSVNCVYGRPVVQLHHCCVHVVKSHGIVSCVSVDLINVGAFAGRDVRSKVNWVSGGCCIVRGYSWIFCWNWGNICREREIVP